MPEEYDSDIAYGSSAPGGIVGLGDADGDALGLDEGDELGDEDGLALGEDDGLELGLVLGEDEGELDGEDDGLELGDDPSEGDCDGEELGLSLGELLGLDDGEELGLLEGEEDGEPDGEDDPAGAAASQAPWFKTPHAPWFIAILYVPRIADNPAPMQGEPDCRLRFPSPSKSGSPVVLFRSPCGNVVATFTHISVFRASLPWLLR